ncbi:gamma-glutamyltransferase [Zavarzinella formosa]|uniref:gamma-glutamyltransferase n=1 Tax=Zavarzinella formosa TaxID=360055 RepID=UPI0002D40E58|nr:gamma-glutamyltransferase [Zavarzinella formosa]
MRLAAGLLMMLTSIVSAQEKPAFKAGRSVVMAPHGMVATSHPLAAQVGVDILRNGGNAFDAAIATSAAMGLMEPMSCGIGGDLFAIVWDAKTQKLYGLQANGRAPMAATRKLFADRGLDEIPATGPLSWSVPGCVDGWDELRKRFGTMNFDKLLAPSIAYAEKGFPVPEVIAGYWKGAEGRHLKVYLPDGQHAPKAGDMFKNPVLAATYREIATKGRDAFYKGDIAAKLDAFSKKHGGLLTADDLAKHTSTWTEPVKTSYHGYDVWELPPPGQGIAALQMLNILEPFDLKKLGPASPDYWHLLTEAKKLAYADRAKYYTDPEFAKVPTTELIGKPYADERRKLIDTKHAMKQVPAGDAKVGKADTIYLCVVDDQRNCVSLIQSNYFGFGSGYAPEALGFALQNRGTLFSLDENHANRLEPGKRPFHTIIPAMVTKEGKPAFVFGVMGGDMQPQGHVQVLINMLDFGMNVQEAGEFPRVEHTGSATPTGHPGAPTGGTIHAEYGIPESVVAELCKRGHIVDRVRKNGGGYQGIWIDPKTGVLQGGSEARKDGMAVGY